MACGRGARAAFVHECDANELQRAVVHELIDWQVSDLIAETSRELRARPPRNSAAVALAEPYVTMSAEVQEYKQGLEKFLRERVYRHPDLLATRKEYQAKLHELFDILCDRPGHCPIPFSHGSSRRGWSGQSAITSPA